MGHQQLLLYTSGLLVAGAAILVGIQKFGASHQDASIEALTLDLTEMAVKAQTYYFTPDFLSGGNHSFSNLTDLEKLFIKPQNENGEFKIVSANDDLLIIQAIGKDDYDGDGQNLTVEAKVYADSVKTEAVSY